MKESYENRILPRKEKAAYFPYVHKETSANTQQTPETRTQQTGQWEASCSAQESRDPAPVVSSEQRMKTGGRCL